jgi:chloride channel, nucleotide-sensitive, 1A
MSNAGRGFEIQYPSITLHAVSRGERGPFVYCQLDESVVATSAVPQAEEEEETTDAEMRELTIIPSDPASGPFLHYKHLYFVTIYIRRLS